jgi:hypothetical protein
MHIVRLLAPFLALAVCSFAHENSPSPSTAPATCIVSGDKLGEMGQPVKYTYNQAGQPDRELEFCCKDCIADFEKDPGRYLAKLDGAAPSSDCCKEAASCCSATAACCKAAGDNTSTGGTASGSDAACCPGGEQGCELLSAYLPIARALAADDLPAARSAAGELAKAANTDGVTPIAQGAEAIASARDLAAARSSFKTLSREVVPLAEGAQGFVVMTCPMAKADWVQSDAKVRNPYYGKTMLTCGAPKKG